MTENRLRRLFTWFLAGFVVLSGCSTPAVSKSMVVQDVQFTKVYPYSVTVTAMGGKETSALDKPQISNEAFEQAIEDSLKKSGLFEKISGNKDSDYFLTVTIFELVQPSFGASFTVKMKSVWSLVQSDPRIIILRESIQSSSTATMGDALGAATRLRLATEGAAQENIRLGIEKLSQLNL
jgi:hypothetical protein